LKDGRRRKAPPFDLDIPDFEDAEAHI